MQKIDMNIVNRLASLNKQFMSNNKSLNITIDKIDTATFEFIALLNTLAAATSKPFMPFSKCNDIGDILYENGVILYDDIAPLPSTVKNTNMYMLMYSVIIDDFTKDIVGLHYEFENDTTRIRVCIDDTSEYLTVTPDITTPNKTIIVKNGIWY